MWVFAKSTSWGILHAASTIVLSWLQLLINSRIDSFENVNRLNSNLFLTFGSILLNVSKLNSVWNPHTTLRFWIW